MGLFDNLLTEVAGRFGLGAKAGPLVSALVSRIGDDQQGGLVGFLDRFRQAGLGDRVASWVGTGTNQPLAPEEAERVLGRDTIQKISSSAGVPAATAGAASAFLIPKVVDLLTPGGSVPASLPTGLLAGLGGAGAGLGAAAAGLAGRARDAAADVTGSARDTGESVAGTAHEAAARFGSAGGIPHSSGWMRKVIPVLVVLLLAFLAYRWLGHSRPTTTGAVATSDTTGRSAAAAPETTTPDTTAPTPTTTGAVVGNAAAAVEEAERNASEALANLKPGYSARELADALNLSIINFRSGSASIPPESGPLLDKAAQAIKGAPKGTVLEVGGHTDNTGNAAGNVRLSERRARAVREALVQRGVGADALTAKGYGSTKPVAGNDSEQGRFKNRRIEFSVVK